VEHSRDSNGPVTGSRGRRVVIVGSGFAGYFAARKLRGAAVDLTVLSVSDSLLYAPFLPEVAIGTIDPRSAVVPLTETLPGVRVVRGRAVGVDRPGRAVHYLDAGGVHQVVPYDRLLLAPGSVTRLLDIPGLAEHGIGLKTVAEALYLRDHVLGRIESANEMADPTRRRAALTFVTVGAGYAGVELTAQMARMIDGLLPLYPRISRDEVHWRRVDVRLGVSIRELTADHVTLTDGTELDSSTVVWCAGVTANPLIATLDLPTTKGRLVVDAELRVPGHPEIYAIGDAAAVPDLTKTAPGKDSHPLCPPTAQHAMRQATAAARNIAADLGDGIAEPYRHRDLGLVVDLGGPDAAATPLGFHLRGRLAKAVTRGYHLAALPTVRRRLRVGTDWALAGRRPDDVSFGLLPEAEALIPNAEGTA